MTDKKIVLQESELPRQWYNIMADMPTPMEPPLHPGTGQPVGPDDLAPIFPMPLILQEVSQERFIDIPEEVLEKYLIWRPTPLYRAFGLEKYLDTPACEHSYQDGDHCPDGNAIINGNSDKPDNLYTHTGIGLFIGGRS